MELGIIRNGDWKSRYIATSFDDAIENCIGYDHTGEHLGNMDDLTFCEEFYNKEIPREIIIRDITAYFNAKQIANYLNTKDYGYLY